jgi:hypothetical protein
MAKTSTSFKKGQGGNPKGRKPLPADIRVARSLSYEEMCRTVIDVRNLTPEDIKKSDMEKMTVGKRAILNAYVKLDYAGIKIYEDRLWGKAKETIDLGNTADGEFKIVFEAIQKPKK